MSTTADAGAVGIDVGGTSVKAAWLRGGVAVRTAQSGAYGRPGFAELARAVGEAVAGLGLGAVPRSVGVCAPGVRDASGVTTAAVNVPGLVGRTLDELVRAGVAEAGGWPGVRVVTDAYAAAHDYRTLHPGPSPDRLLAISLGTGVGACVLDDGVPLIVSGAGPGHLGQVDVGILEAERPVGPDGGVGSLEAYMGLPALRARLGEDLAAAVGGLDVRGVPLRALVQAIRIAHGVYRPSRVVLLGGVGLALRGRAGEIEGVVREGLTGLARSGWRLEVGDDAWHAARGAARLGEALG